MSNVPEIKRRLDRLTQLSKKMGGQFARFSGPEGEEMKKKARKEGTRLGIGAGVSFFGLMIASVASVYILAVVILLVNIAVDRLWLSSLVVVGGFLLIGGVIIAIGAGLAHSSAKELSSATGDITEQMKQTGKEMKAEAEELRELARAEAGEQQRQMKELIEKAKSAAPIAAPIAAGVYLGFRLIKRRIKSRREKRRILRVIELYEERRTREQ